MKHLQKFENFSIDEGLRDMFSGKSAYKNVAAFVEGDSEEAKKVKELYKQIKDSGKDEKDPQNLARIKQITSLGVSWARNNKMETTDYQYSGIRTVLEEDYSRKFKGGSNLTVGESVKFKNKRNK